MSAATAMAPGSSPLPSGPPEVTALLIDTRTLRPFKSSEEYLYAMREDLAEWLNALYPELEITVDVFMDRLEDGVALCKHANNVRKAAREHAERRLTRSMSRSGGALLIQEPKWPAMSPKDVQFRAGVKPCTFFARDNVSNFITWCRHDLGVLECLLFETDDLILRKNEKHVILCLMEVARRGAKFGVPAPMLVQFEREIDREIARDQKRERAGSTSGEGGQGNGEGLGADDEEEEDEEDYPLLQYGPVPQIVTNDLKSLDEMVRDLVERCTCPTQFPMIRVSEGKYRIGDTKVLIFVRILRKHVMVRVGGGWDTLSHYLDKHDPCRCRAGHRGLTGSRLVTKTGNQVDLNTAQVHYERSTPGSPPRTRRSSTSSVGSSGGTPQLPASPARGARQRSRSPRPVTNQQRSRSPRPPVTITTASDSGSEVSDEGYRSLGVNNKLLPPGSGPHDDEVDTTERPESAMTNTSDCSSSTPDDTLPPPRRTPISRRSASPCVRKDTPDSRRATTPSRTTALPRSRSVSGEPQGINTLSPTKSPLSRTAVGYRSVRTKSTVTPPPEQQNTWNAPRSTKSRPTISQDTFQPFGPPSVRRSLPSRSHPSSTHSTPTRKPSRQQQQQNKQPNNSSVPTSPSKHVSPILQQILATSESTQNEVEFLENLRQLINQYDHKLKPAGIDSEALTREWVESEYGKTSKNVIPTPRKSSHDDNDTRIPVPTFYKQSSKGALIDSATASAAAVAASSGLDTTCCL